MSFVLKLLQHKVINFEVKIKGNSSKGIVPNLTKPRQELMELWGFHFKILRLKGLLLKQGCVSGQYRIRVFALSAIYFIIFHTGGHYN